MKTYIEDKTQIQVYQNVTLVTKGLQSAKVERVHISHMQYLSCYDLTEMT